MNKALRELRRQFPDAEISITGTNHYRVRTVDNVTVIVSGTPSRSDFLFSAVADVRRQLKRRQQSRKDITQ
jgi:hypothetical protein